MWHFEELMETTLSVEEQLEVYQMAAELHPEMDENARPWACSG